MINLHHINQRYETALNTHPAKGTPTRKAYLALADSVADVRVLMAEIERLRALKLDDILNGVDWMDSGDEVARWIISAITARGEIRATQIERGREG